MNYSKIKRNIDLFFCIVFLPLVITFVPVGKWIVNYPAFAVTLFVYLYALYFVIIRFNLPRRVKRKNYVEAFLFCLIIILSTYLVSRFPYPAHVTTHHAELAIWNVTHRAQTVWFLSLVVVGYSLSVSLLLELFRQNIIKRELEEEKKNAELALYKAQLNPHFLFNTLNTLYGLVVCKSDKAEDAFVRFTNLMKYAYSRVDAEKISMREEVEYVRNYIELQKLRLNHHTDIRFRVDIDDDTIMIPPMIMISFVENAFKYGTSATRDCIININVSLKGGKLEFECSNKIMKREGEKEDASIGLENTKARLSRIYPGKYELVAEERQGNYYVSLKIDTL